MTAENAASAVTQHAGLTPENGELLGKYAGHLEHSLLTGLGHRRLVSRLRRAARISASATLSASRA
jgi:hypothetical protein